jgi:2-polyprenyl-6-methoxyphenol hydroxylase-like FAD-dependent oxidoreductase
MLWRGLVPETSLDVTPLEGKMARISFSDKLPGHLLMYLVPGRSGSTEQGERLVNWGAYLELKSEDLPSFMVDSKGQLRTGAIPPGLMRLNEQNRLKKLVTEHVPTTYGAMVQNTEGTFVQLLYTLGLPSYHSGRMLLVGDAGAVVPPFTASGVLKGHNNVRDLVNVLDDTEGPVDLMDKLKKWDAEQVLLANNLLTLGDQTEEAFIWNPLDLPSHSPEQVGAWFKKAVTVDNPIHKQAGTQSE